MKRVQALAIVSMGAFASCGRGAADEQLPNTTTAAALSGGVSWRRVSDAPFNSSNAGTYAYDGARNKVWRFEVDNVGTGLMWDWDGAIWTMRKRSGASFGGGPGGSHIFSSMTYDSLRQKIILFGGGDSRQTWEWDGSTWTQRTVATPPPSRGRHGMAYDSARDRVVLFGGDNLSTVLSDTWEWDGTNWVHRAATGPAAPLNAAVSLAYDATRGTTVLLVEGKTWEWDGTVWTERTPAGPSPSSGFLTYDSLRGAVVLFGGNIWLWDGATWTERPATNRPDSGMIAYDSARDRVVLFGKDATNATATWEWDGANWAARMRVPPRRHSAGMAYDRARQEVVMFGGSPGGSTTFTDTWTWNGSIWDRKATAGPGPGLMAYDSARERVVLFRGDTWEWNGSTWEQRTPTGASPLNGKAMTYDAARGNILLLAQGAANSETWTWNGAAWTQLSPLTAPSIFSSQVLAYDSARAKVVMYGSFPTPTSVYETWEWDGSDWTKRSPATSPLSQYGPGMAYDSARGRVVLVGVGSWEWDGTNWASASATGDPMARYWTSLVYDSVRNALVLHGGRPNTNVEMTPFSETWETRQEGTTCTSNAQCPTGTCVDGVCCATTETSCGACKACNVPGSVGVCAPRAGTCNDGNACTVNDTCQAGVCAGAPVTCSAQGECRLPGTCDPATALCSNPPAPDGTSCSGGAGNMCVAGECRVDICSNVTCTPIDGCHAAGVCGAGNGICSTPLLPDGTLCDDGNPRTGNDRCRAGVCAGKGKPPRPPHRPRSPFAHPDHRPFWPIWAGHH